MNEDFSKYLTEIGLTEIVHKRVSNIIDFFNSISTEKIIAIYISEYVKEDKTREYESLWLFTEAYAMEAKQFLLKDEFDKVLLKNQITRWSIEKQNYDFQKASTDSRINLNISIDPRLSGVFKSSGKNCDYLKEIFARFLEPNFRVVRDK